MQKEIKKFLDTHLKGSNAEKDLQTVIDSYVSSNATSSRVTVHVPASVASLGPGYQTFGMALDIWDEFRIEEASEFSIEIEGEGSEHIPRDESNLVVVGVTAAFKKAGREMPNLKYRVKHRIPFRQGLGAPTASMVGGLLGGLVLAKQKLQVNGAEDLLQLAVSRAWSLGNAAPAVYGRAQVCLHNGERWMTEKVPVPSGLVAVIFLPERSSREKDNQCEKSPAVKTCPDSVSRKDAVFNVSRCALLVNCFCSGNLSMLSVAMDDAMNEKKYTYLQPLREAAMAAGAKGVCLCGNGPGVIALTDGRLGDVLTQNVAERTEQDVAIAMLKAADNLKLKGSILVTKPSDIGGYVNVEETSQDVCASDARIRYV